MNGTCGHCRWWSAKERTEAVAYVEAECKRRAPHPPLVGVHDVAVRMFPMTTGEDGCGDFQPAGPEVYREDYREKLGPWFTIP